MVDVFLLSTILIPWLGAIVVWSISRCFPKHVHMIAAVFSVLAGIASLLLIPYGIENIQLTFHLGGVFGDFTLAPDGLSVFLGAVAAVIGALAVIFSKDYMHGEQQLGRYYAFVLFFIGAMVGLVTTTSLLFMFVFWEITALCSYALIAFHNDDPKAVRGGVKALIITQFGGIGLLIGALILYTHTGTYDFQRLIANPDILSSGLLATMAFGCLAAAAAKSAQFPFQTWLPDAMEAPTPISALIHAATMVNAGVYLLARFFPAFEAVPGWREAVMVVGMLSALMAAIMAMVATDLKRVLAYSTVSQLGYMVYAVGAGSVFASQFHLFSHSVFKALLFLAAGAVIHSSGTRDMRKMGGLGKYMPFTRIVFVIGSLALAGLPILNGFWSKELILEAGLDQGNPIWLYLIMLLVAGMTAFYTLRMVMMVFYGESTSKNPVHDAGDSMKIALAPLALGTLSTWLLAGPFGKLLGHSLPYHTIAVHSTLEIVEEVLAAQATWIAMAVVAIGLSAWIYRGRLKWLAQGLKGGSRAAEASFGFEWINQGIVNFSNRAGELLRYTQTGMLNWNVFAVLAGLIAVLLILVLGV